MRMVMISLGCSWVKRMRWRCPDVSKSWCHFGANCCQKSSTEQNSSSILIVEPPGIDTESLLFYHTRWVPYPELTLFYATFEREKFSFPSFSVVGYGMMNIYVEIGRASCRERV